jgi:hypothetical protein
MFAFIYSSLVCETPLPPFIIRAGGRGEVNFNFLDQYRSSPDASSKHDKKRWHIIPPLAFILQWANLGQ